MRLSELGIIDQTASFERYLRGAAQTPLPLPCPFRIWPGSGTWAERDKREVRNFFVFWVAYARAIIGSWHIRAELERKKHTYGKTYISKLASFPNWLLISSPPHVFMVTPRSVWPIMHIVRLTAVSLLLDVGFHG